MNDRTLEIAGETLSLISHQTNGGKNDMRLEVEKGGCSIVLLGSFNPRIFTPYWFVHNGIAIEVEGDTANVNIIHPEISNFTRIKDNTS